MLGLRRCATDAAPTIDEALCLDMVAANTAGHRGSGGTEHGACSRWRSRPVEPERGFRTGAGVAQRGAQGSGRFRVFVCDRRGRQLRHATRPKTSHRSAELELALRGLYGGRERPGVALEVHWAHTIVRSRRRASGLARASRESCENPLLRVEAQVCLVVNDPEALGFVTMVYGCNRGRCRPAPGDDDPLSTPSSVLDSLYPARFPPLLAAPTAPSARCSESGQRASPGLPCRSQ